MSVPYPVFRAALDSGRLDRVMQLAREMPPMRLDDALRVCLLLRDSGDRARYERAVVRWVGRFSLEARDVSLEALDAALTALAMMPEAPEAAMEQLQTLCVTYGVR
jgi:hypothetical protein